MKIYLTLSLFYFCILVQNVAADYCTNNIDKTTDLIQCTPTNITLSYECTKVDYDFLIYSASWQPKLCHEKSCNGSRTWETPKWRIQGLRGSFYNGTRPIQCCSDRQLKIQELDPIYSELEDQWAYEQDANVTDSLIEDWNLHGSCVQQFEAKSSLQLYRQSLDIAKKLPLQVWLSNARIKPSNDKKYDLEFFNYTIATKLGKMFQMRCKTLDYDKGLSIIDTINVCVDRYSNEVIDCPDHFDSNCLETVYYPTHKLERKISEEMTYRDLNYYPYANYHHSYSPMYSSRAFLTGAAVGAVPTAALAVPAAYYYAKNKNKDKEKYANGFPVTYGSTVVPWYSSTAFASSFAASSMSSSRNLNLASRSSQYPRQRTANYYPLSIFSTHSNLNTLDLSPNFNPSYPSYPPPRYTPYSSHPNTGGSNVPSYPRYPSSGGLPDAPPPYSRSYNKYPKQSSFDNPPPYSASSGKRTPSAPSLNDFSYNKAGKSSYSSSSSSSAVVAANSYSSSYKPSSSSSSFLGGLFSGLSSSSRSRSSGSWFGGGRSSGGGSWGRSIGLGRSRG